jgi:putative ABC transport system permease protein
MHKGFKDRWIVVTSIWSDVKYAMRMLVRNPLFSSVAVVTLALGIGANSAVFTVIRALVIRPLPFEDSDRLVFVHESDEEHERMSVSYPNLEDWRRQNDVFTDVAAHRVWDVALTGPGQPQQLTVAEVSAQLFGVLGSRPLAGRFFVEGENDPEAERVVVISYRLWQRHFGGEATVVGRAITLENASYTVIGIAPRGFIYPLDRPDVEAYLPHVRDFFRSYDRNRGTRAGLKATARLKDGVSLEEARAEMTVIAARLAQEYPRANQGHTVVVEPLQEYLLGDMRQMLFVLLAAVGLVLLIACANVANLLLGRASARAREIAIRSSLGAGGGRVVRQLLTESLLLSVLGGAVGVLMAFWGVQLLLLILPSELPVIYQQIAVDGPVLGFTVLLSVATGIVFGLAPALQASRQDLAGVLREEGRTTSDSVRRSRSRELLVITETALAVLLLVSAGLVLRSFANLSATDLGFNPKGLLTMQVILPPADFEESDQRAAFYRGVQDEIATLPGVHSVSLFAPMLGGWDNAYVVADRPVPGPGDYYVADIQMVSPGYFRTMEIPLVRGRHFSDQDRADTRRVAIVDEDFSARHWPNEDALGKRVKLGTNLASARPWAEIIGVVGHVKSHGAEGESREAVYFPLQQREVFHHVLVARTESQPEKSIAAVTTALAGLVPDRPIYGVQTMKQYLGVRLAGRRVTLILLGVFAAIAVLLAAGGTYSVIAYSVALRTPEFGIRTALGASSGDVHRLVLGSAVRLTSMGIGLGLLAAFLATSLLSSLLFGVGARDPVTFVGVGVVLAIVALAASVIPAVRATRVLPMVALRKT